jgi:glycosyltransferase involved in cell wall biosynthesis
MLSIIIPTYNEEKYLPKLLESIKKQDFNDYEIIVADNKSKDKTREVAKRYGCKIVDGGMPGHGRNKGANAAKGDYLLFLDSDVVLPEGFLRENFSYFLNKKLVCAIAWSKPISDKAIDKVLFFSVNSLLNLIKHFKPHGCGFCIFTLKNVFDDIGGFDESIRVGEDVDFMVKTKKYGKFDVIKKKNIYVSVRRLNKEGRMNYALKLFKTTFYDFIGKKIRDERDIEYKFGY